MMLGLMADMIDSRMSHSESKGYASQAYGIQDGMA